MPIKTTWNLTSLKDDDLKQVEQESYKFINKWIFREDYLSDPKILKEALDEYEMWGENFGVSGDTLYKIQLEMILDQNNPELKSKYNKHHNTVIKIVNDIEFFTLRLARISHNKQNEMLDSKDLKEYKHILEKIFEGSKYLLSEPEEKIMNLKSKVSHENWVEMVENFLSKEERGEKSFAEIMSLLSDEKKATRDKAADWFNDILKTHLDVAEHEVNSILENDRIDNELRGYKRPDESRHISDDVNSKIVDTLLETVEKNFDISTKFYELKAKLLGQEKLEYHERNVSYGNINKKIEFEEAVNTVRKTFSTMDGKFLELFENYLEKGQIDAFPIKNKSSGAMCISNLKRQPTFIFLNFTGRITDVTTLAHEMGHAIHHELAKKAQNSLNDGASLAVAEVASTFMEDFALDEVAKDLDNETKLALQMEQLNEQVSSIQRQVACYRFEQALHAEFNIKGYLSKEDIGSLFQEKMKAYMGDFVEYPSEAKNWWVYWSHIRNFFYVYSYASGLLISKSLQKKVRENPKFIKDFKELLSKGTSVSPRDAFLGIGIDIAKKDFWEAGLTEQRELLNNTWTLAQKLGKI